MMRSAFAVAMVLALAACGEKPQTIGQSAAKKQAGNTWDTAQSDFLASGWKPGDKASWEAQMRTRAQSQNENSRIAAVPTAAK
jgi:predicted small lipoprotein YifL